MVRVVEDPTEFDDVRKQGIPLATIEYGPDDKRQTFPGVLTTAEVMPGGALKMFHFFPEIFAGIYEKRKRKSEIARASTRKVLAMLSDLKGSSRE